MSIAVRQNLTDNVQLLAAQRRLYGVAKRISAIQAVLAAGTPMVAAVIVAKYPSAAIWSALAGILVPLFDNGILDPMQQKFREDAASVQEEFDSRVLELPWNEAVAGPRPAREETHEAAKAYKEQSNAPLENWYPSAVSSLPVYQGRLICQRTNCWRDSKLRRRYAGYIIAVLSIISTFVLLVGIWKGMTLEKFVLAVLAPLSPALLWGIREVHRQRSAASALDRLREYGRSLWARAVGNTLSEREANALSRELQDAIFYRRRENPFVFDWIYRLLRNRYEEQMNVGAEAMVQEITSATRSR